MGLFDDVAAFLDDVRQAGEELEGLKQEVVSSVVEFGREATETVGELRDTLTEESVDE